MKDHEALNQNKRGAPMRWPQATMRALVGARAWTEQGKGLKNSFWTWGLKKRDEGRWEETCI